MAGILDLPPEITTVILNLLPGHAIKAVRASCKQLNYTASPFLYPVLYLSCHQLDLEVFRLVAKNPLLLGGVRELVIDDTTLAPSLSDWRIYHAVASWGNLWSDRKRAYFCENEDKAFDEPERQWSSGPDKELWELFMSVYKGHHENRLAHADIKALKQALPNLKSLRSLIITNRNADEMHHAGAQSEDSSSPVVKMWRRVGTERRERPPFPPRCDWWAAWGKPMERTDENMFSLDWLDDELQRKIDEEGLPYAEGDDGEDGRGPGRYLHYTSVRSIAREARALLVALEVLTDSHMRSQITDFRVDASHDMVDQMYQPGLPIRLFDLTSPFPERLATAFGAVTNHTSFHLVISNTYQHWDGQYIMSQGQVGRVLASMPNLEDLMLEAHCMSTVEAIPDDLTFSRLRRVEFSCGDIVPEKLVAFIRRHASTLQTLLVQDCSIDPDEEDGTWEDVVRDISTLQDEGTTKLGEAKLWNVYGFKPFTGCGKNCTIDFLGSTWEMIYSWEYGVDDDLVKMMDVWE
ncbi:hypothetical protein FDECE_16086 [Fusarium decemcellulare]|nr:hypothetical protein FDECE_16086 [Fusarium decemcellulare]